MYSQFMMHGQKNIKFLHVLVSLVLRYTTGMTLLKIS